MFRCHKPLARFNTLQEMQRVRRADRVIHHSCKLARFTDGSERQDIYDPGMMRRHDDLHLFNALPFSQSNLRKMKLISSIDRNRNAPFNRARVRTPWSSERVEINGKRRAHESLHRRRERTRRPIDDGLSTPDKVRGAENGIFVGRATIGHFTMKPKNAAQKRMLRAAFVK